MAASQVQREEQKEKKQSVRLHQLENVSKQGSSSESPPAESAALGKANRFHNRSPAVTDQTPSSYPTTASYSYYYPGYNGSVGDYYDQGYYVAANAMDTQYPVVQTDGSIVYVMPGVYSGYDPYTSFMPLSAVEGQYVGQQAYPSSPVFQAPIPSPDYNVTSLPHTDLVQTPYLWNPSSFLVGDGALGNGYLGVLGMSPSKPNSSGAVSSTNGPNFKSSKLSDSANLSLDVISGNNKNLEPFNKASSHVSSFQSDLPPQGYYGVAKFPFHNQGKGGLLYSKPNVKGWGGLEKLKTRSKVSGFDDAAKLVDDKSQGPVTINGNGALGSGVNSAEPSGDDKVGNGVNMASQVRRDQYNLAEFSTKYEHAFFFVIKSYSEDDIHKSIKYNVWASTPNGNKRLSSAFQEAQEKMAEIGSKCPVFLFFSVNASGQFCGVAEMIGQVDFNKSMDFWQQSKWNGYFPVKWHIIKDIPNAQLRHIILQNNENKPVTNSRDTQEVKFHQGIEMLGIFKNYTSVTSILDDFDFYENRQKIMQEKRLRQSLNHRDLQLKVDELTTGIQSVDLSTVKNI